MPKTKIVEKKSKADTNGRLYTHYMKKIDYSCGGRTNSDGLADSSAGTVSSTFGSSTFCSSTLVSSTFGSSTLVSSGFADCTCSPQARTNDNRNIIAPFLIDIHHITLFVHWCKFLQKKRWHSLIRILHIYISIHSAMPLEKYNCIEHIEIPIQKYIYFVI